MDNLKLSTAARTHGALSPRERRLCFALVLAFIPLIAAYLPLFNGLRLRFDMLWNYFLAMLPLGFAVLALALRRGGRRWWWLPCILWAAFFPNAPYILTDLIHLSVYTYVQDGHYAASLLSWLGFAHILFAAAAAAVAGYLSLCLIHRLVRRRFGGGAGWAFAACMGFLGGAGVFIGRFLRFNSWDLATRPLSVLEGLEDIPLLHSMALVLLFAALIFCGYVLFWLCFVPASGEQ